MPLDSQHLVPFRHSFAPTERTDFELSGIGRYREVRNERVLSFAGARRDHGQPAVLLGAMNGGNSLRHRAHLVQLDEYRVSGAQGESAVDSWQVGRKQIVPD